MTQSATPLFYDIVDKNGIRRYYRILYNSDFIEILPTEKAKPLTEDDVVVLLDNFDDEEIWREKFPPNSWIIKGFGLISLFDATVEYAMSDLKQYLFVNNNMNFRVEGRRIDLLKSIFNNPSIDVGMSTFNPENEEIRSNRFNYFIRSHLLEDEGSYFRNMSVKNSVFLDFLKEDKTFIISDVDELVKRHPQDTVALQLQKRKIKSCLLIPVIKDGRFMAIAEMVSYRKFGFNSISTHKIQSLKEILTDGIENTEFELSNYISALIQKEYTSVHESVAWKFRREIENFIKSGDPDYRFKDITFRDVYALFGDVDIRGSSVTRNRCIRADLTYQLEKLLEVLDELENQNNMVFPADKKQYLQSLLNEVKNNFEAHTEQETQQYIADHVHSFLSQINFVPKDDSKLTGYLLSLDPHSGLYYRERRKFDRTIAEINKRFSEILDIRQKDIQKSYPHYFEKFSTDGIEHSMYIGPSIAPDRQFSPAKLHELRFWQLQVTCEMMLMHRKHKNELPIPMDITSLILTFSVPISIRFRKDGKRFDIDGAYNASYEIVKKRIDKALVANSNERITQTDKITVVYVNAHEEKEYLNYFNFLRTKGLIEGQIELLEIEKLQGIKGLKAIRATISYKPVDEYFKYCSYEELAEKHPISSLTENN